MREFQSIHPTFNLEPEVAVFLIAQNPIGLKFTTHKINVERVYQEMILLEHVLLDENANSLVVCLALQNAKYLIENFIKTQMMNQIKSEAENEIRQIGGLIRRLKKVTKKSVAKRNRKFFSSDRAEVKLFDKFLDQLIWGYHFEASFIKKIILFFTARNKKWPGTKLIKTASISTEIQDFRFLKTYDELETKIAEFFNSTLDLNVDFRKALYDFEFRHCIQLALQSTSTTKDGSLLRETKLVKLLLDDSVSFKKNLVEFESPCYATMSAKFGKNPSRI